MRSQRQPTPLLGGAEESRSLGAADSARPQFLGVGLVCDRLDIAFQRRLRFNPGLCAFLEDGIRGFLGAVFSAIILKAWMALTGLFLVLFLVVHVLGNTQLFLAPETAQSSFNAYSQALVSNPLIRLAGWLTYGSVVIHVIVSVVVTRRNRKARAIGYQREAPGANSRWYSRWMGILGVVLLVFLVLHMWAFWFPYHYASLGIDPHGHKDLYAVVRTEFTKLGVVVFYVFSMVAVGFHVQHGFVAGLRSLGLYGPGAAHLTRRFAAWLAWTIAGLFAAMPIYVYLRELE